MQNGIRVFAALTMLLGIAFSAVGVSAQTTDSASELSCVTADLGGQQLQIGIADRTSAVSVALPAGTVEITSARATDTYPSRANVTQNSEKYEVEFLSASGAVIATSATTGDVEDNIEFGEWIGSLGTVELSEPAVAIRAHHRPDLPGDGSPQSVRANEITFCFDGSTSSPEPVCGDEGVTNNPDGTPCTPDPVCGDEGVTNNPDGTPCTPVTTEGETTSPTITTLPESTTTTEDGEVAGPTTSTTAAEETTTTTEATTSTTAGEEVAGPEENQLPLTGSNTALLLTFGGFMVIAGGALTLTNRRLS